MTARVRLYLDTSVISACFDARDRSRQELARQFWASLWPYEPTISGLVLTEL